MKACVTGKSGKSVREIRVGEIGVTKKSEKSEKSEKSVSDGTVPNFLDRSNAPLPPHRIAARMKASDYQDRLLFKRKVQGVWKRVK